jgi:hypothetical protein
VLFSQLSYCCFLFLGPNVLLSTFSQTLSLYIVPLGWQTKFCIHTKQWVELYRFLGCDAMQCCNRMPTFWTTLLLPSLGWSAWWQEVDLNVWAANFTLKMGATRSSKMLVSYCNTIWCHNAEHFNLNLHHHEDLKSSFLSSLKLQGLLWSHILCIILSLGF